MGHTITCQCTICNNNFQQAQSLDVRERSTARNKLAPQSQQDRLHPNEGHPKGSKSCLRVSKIDSIEESALQEINWYLEVNKIGFTKNEDRNQIGSSGSSKSTPSKKAHCKIKLVPRGQQNRLHLNEDKTKNWCLWVSKTDSIEESAL